MKHLRKFNEGWALDHAERELKAARERLSKKFNLDKSKVSWENGKNITYVVYDVMLDQLDRGVVKIDGKNIVGTKDYKNGEVLFKINEGVKDEIRARVEKDNDEKKNREYYAKHGKLSQYIESKGEVFTFGMLRAIFEDSLDAKRKRDLAKGGYKFLHRAIPYANAALTVNPIIWFIGMVFGSLRAFNKIIAQVLKDPGRNYPEFLKKIVVNTMNVAEGEIKPLLGEDKFFNLFVVSDDITKIVRKDVLLVFANELCEKMSEEPDDKEVPDHYIENELKAWLHQIYDLTYTFKKKGKGIKKYKPSKIEIRIDKILSQGS